MTDQTEQPQLRPQRLRAWIAADPEYHRVMNETQFHHAFLYNNSDGAAAIVAANPAMLDSASGRLISGNPHPWAIAWLQANPDKINWRELSRNPHPWAVDMLQSNTDKIHWRLFSANPHPWAVEMLLTNPDKIDRNVLSMNPHPWAVAQTLARGVDGIRWSTFTRNPNPDAVALMREQRTDRLYCIDSVTVKYKDQSPWSDANLDQHRAYCARRPHDCRNMWSGLSSNPHPWAMEMLEANRNKIRWDWFLTNPAIFEDIPVDAAAAIAAEVVV